MSSQLHGMGDLVKRLERIAIECGEKPQKEVAPRDEFVHLKQQTYALLEECREDIRERQALLQRRGNCVETIQKGHLIRQRLEELRRAPPKLQELHKRAQSKRGAAARKEELQMRYQDIRVLKKQVDEVNELFQNLSAGGDGVTASDPAGASSPAAKLFGLRRAANGNEEDNKRLLNEDEQQAMARIGERDRTIDRHLDEVGKVVDRLNPLAHTIGATAERQKTRLEAVGTDVEKADQDLQALSKRVTEVIKYEKNTTCACQLVLGIAFLCCLGFIFQQLQ
mmetsp:Transcript_36117/g.78873  ORF Transcript_36117/g.78873 Transcript_36117/m.78873 type:complete len:281 (-) Transcript_36117:32-874(-)|eukprot:CAMPEP_0170610144 /NCGR_PEP_ID=MMETSP0224-20130122/22497_1 /TAXON_ID=285029 /ORGANISM="Togula jolla, Strain CCCM 725" /LENGTH=280 /DNA_ID=CAMNT_0010935489 /DNA_START=67 /DNA_END=909 /DNA_ORIENTATION=+